MEKQDIECQNCGYIWETRSEMNRVTCPSCTQKTKRIKPKGDKE